MSHSPSDTTARALPQPGQVLAGKFRVERVLGAGGMGVVVAAHHMLLDRRVALKFLLPELTATPTLVARFAREAKAAARIQSEHVARVIDVGTLETGAPYMVMEYLEGRDLGDELKATGKLVTTRAVDWLLQACEAIAEAHAAGIVHRDLKPGNLFLTRRADGNPLIKVLDFGISKHLLLDTDGANAGPALTQTMAQLGSPAYMSPEQLRSSKDVDPRTDIWALGLILQEMLTGEIAFAATSIVELHVAILTKPPQPLRASRPDLPETLELVVARCLEKDPALRFQNLAELAFAVAPFGSAAARQSAESIARVLGVAPALPPPAPAGPTVAEAPAHMPQASTQAAGYPAAQHQAHGADHTSAGYGGFGPGPGPGHIGAGPNPGGHGGGHGGGPGGGPGGGHGGGPGGAPMAQHGYGGYPQGYGHTGMVGHPGPMGAPYRGPAAERGTSTTVIVLVVVLATIVFVMGGCVLCVCIGAAQQSQRVDDPLRDHWASLPLPPSPAGLSGIGGVGRPPSCGEAGSSPWQPASAGRTTESAILAPRAGRRRRRAPGRRARRRCGL